MERGTRSYHVDCVDGVNLIAPARQSNSPRVRIIITLITGTAAQLGHDSSVMDSVNSGLFVTGVGAGIIDEDMLTAPVQQGAWFAYASLNDIIGIYEEFKQ